MSDIKILKAAFLLAAIPFVLSAQNTNSPYSRFGYGILENPALGSCKSMGGTGIGIRENNMINPANPASYSAIDTLTMLWDFGVSGNYSTFKESSVHQGNPNGGLDYVAMKIPLKPWWGVAIGLTPYSKVGYAFSHKYVLPNKYTYTDNYSGVGGLNTLFLGTSVALGKSFGVGVNYKYVFGTITQSSSTSSSNDDDFTSRATSENWYMNASTLELGLQYATNLDKKNRLVLGATFSEKMPVNTTVYTVTMTTDTTDTSVKSDFGLPRTIGLGASWVYDSRLTLALDYLRQNWADVKFHGAKDSLSNCSRISFGAEYLPAIYTTHYYEAIKYRFGAYYSDSYIRNFDYASGSNDNQKLGNLRNVGMTVGIGLPLRGQRSELNLSFEAGKLLLPSASMIHENYYKLSLGITFNETWFFKRKL